MRLPNVVAILDPPEGELSPASRQCLGAAQALARMLSGQTLAVAAGLEVETAAAQAAALSHGEVLTMAPLGPQGYEPALWLTELACLAEVRGADYLLLPPSSFGQDFGPALAARLGAAHVAGVEALEAGAEGPVFLRRAAGGKLSARVVAQAGPVVLGLAAGSFGEPPANPRGPAPVRRLAPVTHPGPLHSLGHKAAEHTQAGLTRAEVVVAAGLGMGGPENLPLLEKVAGLFKNSALGASRPVCDLGWLPYGRQVGQTGATVSPRLYLACGISGASQHKAGMAGAEFIVAVNSDPAAPIFQFADLGVVADLKEFLPFFLEAATVKA